MNHVSLSPLTRELAGTFNTPEKLASYHWNQAEALKQQALFLCPDLFKHLNTSATMKGDMLDLAVRFKHSPDGDVSDDVLTQMKHRGDAVKLYRESLLHVNRNASLRQEYPGKQYTRPFQHKITTPALNNAVTKDEFTSQYAAVKEIKQACRNEFLAQYPNVNRDNQPYTSNKYKELQPGWRW
jgi:hypothetical protein